MKKTQLAQSVREQKADALDRLVKAEIAKSKAVDAAKTARLRALRIARDEEEAAKKASEPPEAPAPKRSKLHLRSPH